MHALLLFTGSIHPAPHAQEDLAKANKALGATAEASRTALAEAVKRVEDAARAQLAALRAALSKEQDARQKAVQALVLAEEQITKVESEEKSKRFELTRQFNERLKAMKVNEKVVWTCIALQVPTALCICPYLGQLAIGRLPALAASSPQTSQHYFKLPLAPGRNHVVPVTHWPVMSQLHAVGPHACLSSHICSCRQGMVRWQRSVLPSTLSLRAPRSSCRRSLSSLRQQGRS